MESEAENRVAEVMFLVTGSNRGIIYFIKTDAIRVNPSPQKAIIVSITVQL